jgi:hypothetical protein
LISSSAFSRSNCASVSAVPPTTSAPDGRAALSRSALFHALAALWMSSAVAAASMGDKP